MYLILRSINIYIIYIHLCNYQPDIAWRLSGINCCKSEVCLFKEIGSTTCISCWFEQICSKKLHNFIFYLRGTKYKGWDETQHNMPPSKDFIYLLWKMYFHTCKNGQRQVWGFSFIYVTNLPLIHTKCLCTNPHLKKFSISDGSLSLLLDFCLTSFSNRNEWKQKSDYVQFCMGEFL